MKMKNSLMISVLAVIFAIMFTGCDTVQNLFSRDLNLKLMVEKADGLHENSLVYLIQPDNEKRIGIVTKIKTNKTGNSLLYLSIEREFRDKVKEGTLFMVDRPLLSVAPPYILADILPKDINNPTIASGTIVYETSYAKYSMMMVGNAMKGSYTKVKAETEQFMSELQGFLNSEEFDEMLDELNQLTEDIASFTVEQKEKFEKDVLPQLKEKIDEAIKAFGEDETETEIKNYEKREQMKKELERLKNTLRA